MAHGIETPALSSESLPSGNTVFAGQGNMGVEQSSSRDSQPFGVLTPNPPLPEGHPGATGQRFFTVQRVNGNGANGKNDGVDGGHRHSLEESDRVKKNSVQRYLLKEAKEQKKATAVSSGALRHFPTSFSSPLLSSFSSAVFFRCSAQISIYCDSIIAFLTPILTLNRLEQWQLKTSNRRRRITPRPPAQPP